MKIRNLPILRRAKVFIFFFLISFSGHAGTLITYSTLQKSSADKAIRYLQSLHQSLATSSESRFDRIIARRIPSSSCARKNMWTCFPGIYGLDRCVRSPKNARKTCGRAISSGNLVTYLENPEFYRSGWNAFMAGVSGECKKNYTITCKALIQLKGHFLGKIKKE